MTKKTARTHSKKNTASNRQIKPLFSFTWMLVVFLVLFVLTGIVIGINTAKHKSPLNLLGQKESGIDAATMTGKKEMGWQDYRDAAILDVKKTLNQPIKSVKLVSYEKTEWSDSSLGCPKAGSMYTQVITPGYKLVLLIDGKEYSYHAGSNYVVACNR